MPVVSVLMVCHRDTPFLRPAIASVRAQTFADWELVLVDNGAGLTPETLGEVGRDPRLRWVRLGSNQGIPAGHNAGVAAAQGEFIALLDHDDVMLPMRLERQVALLRAQPELGLVASQAETIDEAGRVIGREFSRLAGEDQRRYSQFACPVVTPAYTGRREVFVALPYREQFSLTADFDFVARAAEKFPLGGVPEVLLQYRRHTAQATQMQAALIEWQRGVVRLLTAQRRAGRLESANEWSAEKTVGSPAMASLDCARHGLRAGWFELAAYQARRAISLSMHPAVLVAALGLAGQAISVAPMAERRRAARLFFTGPVRALDLAAE